MRALLLFLAVGLTTAVVVAFATPSEAHACNSGTPGGCGPCTGAGSHQHNDPTYQCSTPGFEALGLLGALALIVVARHRT
jgi:hypothetical protein